MLTLYYQNAILRKSEAHLDEFIVLKGSLRAAIRQCFHRDPLEARLCKDDDAGDTHMWLHIFTVT